VGLSSIPNALRQRVFIRDGGACRYCLLRQIGQGAVFHINHVLPRSKGGATVIEKLVLQCPHCSLHKSDRIELRDHESEIIVPIFHPLRQEWQTHFVMKQDGRIVAIDATARVTIAALHMNDVLPSLARRMQIMLGLLDAPPD